MATLARVDGIDILLVELLHVDGHAGRRRAQTRKWCDAGQLAEFVALVRDVADITDLVVEKVDKHVARVFEFLAVGARHVHAGAVDDDGLDTQPGADRSATVGRVVLLAVADFTTHDRDDF